MDYFLKQGYPLPDEMTNEAIQKMAIKYQELEDYAVNVML